MKAEEYLNAGYQRLLTFERPGGGFDWWGSGEPLIWLSAYGLHEFNDMSKVWPVDRGVIEVVPDGQMKEQVANNQLAGKTTHTFTIPHNAIPDASKLMVKVYPGVFSQVLEGVEGLIRLPGG